MSDLVAYGLSLLYCFATRGSASGMQIYAQAQYQCMLACCLSRSVRSTDDNNYVNNLRINHLLWMYRKEAYPDLASESRSAKIAEEDPCGCWR